MACRHKRFAALSALGATVVFLLIGTLPALGVPPTQPPATIRSIGFEVADELTLAALPGDLGEPATKAYWGRTTGARHSGTYGLWCAATGAPFGYYPDGTRGIATASVPELADYFDSSISLWYLMASRGSNDEYAFRVAWNDVAATMFDYYNQFTRKTTWTQRTFNLSDPASSANLSRIPGSVNVQFYDEYFPDTNGRGPTVDDIVISGYKYGPVRNVTAVSPVLETVLLTWDPPATSTRSSADDTRTIGYRIWRTIAGNDSWQEVTPSSGRVSTTSFSDTSVVQGASYEYAVQAWDPGTGSGYGRQAVNGEYAPVLVDGAPLPTATLSAPSAPSTARTWASFLGAGTLSPAHTGSAPVQIQCSRTLGGPIVATFIASFSAPATTYSVPVHLTEPGVWYLRARHADESHSESLSAWTKVTVSNSPILGAPKPRSTMRKNRTYTVSGTIRPRHTATYLRVRAYRWNGKKYVYKKTIKVTTSTSGQPADTTKYSARVKLTSKGKWRLKAKHYAHGGEPEKYSSFSSRITVK